jgi:hypothetical protein
MNTAVRISPVTGKPVRAYKKKNAVAKKRGRPSKANTVRQYDNDLKTLGKLLMEKEHSIINLVTQLKDYETKMNNLKVDMLDQQAVINYLEKKLIK